MAPNSAVVPGLFNYFKPPITKLLLVPDTLNLMHAPRCAADQRDNRAFVAQLCKGKSVLDLCCYRCGRGWGAMCPSEAEAACTDHAALLSAHCQAGNALPPCKKPSATVKRDQTRARTQRLLPPQPQWRVCSGGGCSGGNQCHRCAPASVFPTCRLVCATQGGERQLCQRANLHSCSCPHRVLLCCVRCAAHAAVMCTCTHPTLAALARLHILPSCAGVDTSAPALAMAEDNAKLNFGEVGGWECVHALCLCRICSVVACLSTPILGMPTPAQRPNTSMCASYTCTSMCNHNTSVSYLRTSPCCSLCGLMLGSSCRARARSTGPTTSSSWCVIAGSFPLIVCLQCLHCSRGLFSFPFSLLAGGPCVQVAGGGTAGRTDPHMDVSPPHAHSRMCNTCTCVAPMLAACIEACVRGHMHSKWPVTYLQDPPKLAPNRAGLMRARNKVRC